MSTTSPEPEHLVCENCHHVNIILNTPNKRRERKDRHLKLEDAIYDLILLEKVRVGGDIQDALANLFYRIQEYERRFGKIFVSHKRLSRKVESMTTPILGDDEIVSPT